MICLGSPRFEKIMKPGAMEMTSPDAIKMRCQMDNRV